MDNRRAKCWLCGRDVGCREDTQLLRHSGIPVHRECLENGRRYAGVPLAEPDDVIYFSQTLFRT